MWLMSQILSSLTIYLLKIWKNAYMKEKNTHTILSKLYIHVHSALEFGKQATRYG